MCTWDETRAYKLHSQRRLRFRFFSVLPVLYTQDTFAPFLNFKVGHFVRHFLFLSFDVAMKGIQFTQLRCHISSLVHSVRHLFYFYPAVYDCWIHVNDSTPLVVSLNDESRLAHRRQQSASSAFQLHYISIDRKSAKTKKTEMERKTTVWIFQGANQQDCRREDLDVRKKEKSQERNWISFNSSTKRHHKDQ